MKTNLRFLVFLLLVGDAVMRAQTYTWTTLAGQTGQAGNIDGIGRSARFADPQGVAVDAAGNVYVADSANCSIRKITPAGVVTTFAGSTTGEAGSTDGVGTTARFDHPLGVAVDRNGTVYVADSSNCTIRKITPTGQVSTLAGLARSSADIDGPGASARFAGPAGLTVDNAGNVYVADSRSYRIRKIAPNGVVTTLNDNRGDIASFLAPSDVALDSAGNIYVPSPINSTIVKLTPAGVSTVFAGQNYQLGSIDGPVNEARFAAPEGIATDAADNLYVAELSNDTIRKISPAGVVTTLIGRAGQGSADGPGDRAQLSSPRGVAVDGAGNLYVTDEGNFTIRKGVPDARLSFVAEPQAQTCIAGGSATFAVEVTGSAPNYQWCKDGLAIAGATTASYTIGNISSADAGSYSVEVRDASGSLSLTSRPALLSVTDGVSRLSNLAVRSPAGTGDKSLVVGFSTSAGTKQILLRGVGPTLAQFGVGGTLGNPWLRLFNSASALIDQNDDWGGASALTDIFVRVGAFDLPKGSKDAALFVRLPAGSYTAQVAGDTDSGVALVEVYDADAGSPAACFMSLAARNEVGTGENILIAGFGIAGNVEKKLLIRGIGPTLARFGVNGVLADPQLQVLDSHGRLVGENDDWGNAPSLSTAFAQTGAFALPADSKDAALLVTLPPGSYTVLVSGSGSTTGVALVEVYAVP